MQGVQTQQQQEHQSPKFFSKIRYLVGKPSLKYNLYTGGITRMILINHIMYAEDDKDDQAIMQEVLKDIRSEIKLDFASNGELLIKILRSFHPDMLFLDLDMPCKNGLECLVEIRKSAQLKLLPIVVFSSTNRAHNIQTAYEMGANLFLMKPHLYQELVASIEAILSLDWSDPEHVKAQYFVNGRYVAFT
jgi:CheY-like chemotaxis protein